MRFLRARFVAIIFTVAIASPPTAHATDHVVDFTCIGSDLNADFTLDYVVPESAPELTIEVLAATQFGRSRPWVARCDAPQAVHQACALGGRAAIGGNVAPCALATATKS